MITTASRPSRSSACSRSPGVPVQPVTERVEIADGDLVATVGRVGR
jgi:hypothetical protein